MTTELETRPRVLINVRTSSSNTKGSQEAYEITADERATEVDVDAAWAAVKKARDLVRAELGLDATLVQQLEASLEAKV